MNIGPSVTHTFCGGGQFLTSSELGVKRARATLNTLRQLPTAIASLTNKELNQWLRLHTQLINTTPIDRAERQDQGIHPERQGTLLNNSHQQLEPLLNCTAPLRLKYPEP